MITLKTINRAEKEAQTTDDSMIKAVMYGNNIPSVSLSVNRIDFGRVLKEAGTATVITLDTESGMKTALIHDMQRTPAGNKISHIDFYLVDAAHTIRVEVPLKFNGIAPGEKDGLGNLLKPVQTVEVECLPADLPSHFDVSVESLCTLEDNICVSDIILPKGVVMLTEGDVVIATISEMQEDVESEALDLEKVETTDKKGKKEVKE